MKTITIPSVGPLSVVPVPDSAFQNTQHFALLAPDGREVARVWGGDDSVQARALAERMAIAEDALLLLRKIDADLYTTHFGMSSALSVRLMEVHDLLTRKGLL